MNSDILKNARFKLLLHKDTQHNETRYNYFRFWFAIQPVNCA